ncbi:MAG: hypothetical protein KKD01_01390 [Proteobacteria bacterium]|nr:hypothetical protein [Pseudomonadota bacterium]MBU1418243.1 hypothetical protein [Pseudomonadota bacterium]MBU1453353.1 hypothetical protein [Pseudomonadota bacterium]
MKGLGPDKVAVAGKFADKNIVCRSRTGQVDNSCSRVKVDSAVKEACGVDISRSVYGYTLSTIAFLPTDGIRPDKITIAGMNRCDRG